jgi:fatty-acyl-CoA synthase
MIDVTATQRLDSPITLPSTMMDVQMTIPWILAHALRNHPDREIVSRSDSGPLYRGTFADFGARVAQLAHALVELGVRPGDRVASFAWNTHRHLELYYAVPSIGAVLHTANIRLFPDQVAWAFEHADDKLVFVDGTLAPALRAVTEEPGFNRPIVVMGDPIVELPNARSYEELLAGRPTTFDWPEIDERSAAILCYTSATTGDPKGVAFSHRSSILHAIAGALGDALDIRQRDTLLPIVPMFHVNAWGMPFIGPMIGAKIVMPGARLDPASLIELIDSEGVTVSAGVPTVWLPLLDELNRRNAFLPSLDHLVIGGSACPPSLFDGLEARGIHVVHAWGMTEMSPIGTVSQTKAELAGATPERRREERLKQGTFTPLVAWKLIGDNGEDVPSDGVSRGQLWVRGPAVTGSYYRSGGAGADSFQDGWFHTGDICTVDALGYMQLVDRSKDLVKSGGEWISSVDLENLLMGHPALKEAAVIAAEHPKWVERPIACVVIREGHTADEAEIQAWLAERVAKWWVPDRIVFVDAIPRTGVGKFLKRELRERYRGLLTEG